MHRLSAIGDAPVRIDSGLVAGMMDPAICVRHLERRSSSRCLGGAAGSSARLARLSPPERCLQGGHCVVSLARLLVRVGCDDASFRLLEPTMSSVRIPLLMLCLLFTAP